MRSPRQRRQLFLFLGALLIVAGIGLNIMLPRLLGASTAGPSAPAASVPLVPVVVTATSIGQGEQFTAVNLTTALFPITLQPQGSYSSLSQVVSTDAAKAKFATIALGPGVAVTSDMVVNTAAEAGGIGYTPLVIPQGDIPYTLAFDSRTMGYFLAGDRLDVIALDPSLHSFYAFTDIPVLRMGNPSEQGPKGSPSVVVLIVTRQQALALTDLLGTGTGNQVGGYWQGKPGYSIYRWVIRSPQDP